MYGHHRDLHGLTHSFPTRRSSDLGWPTRALWCRPRHRPRSRSAVSCCARSSRGGPTSTPCSATTMMSPSALFSSANGLVSPCQSAWVSPASTTSRCRPPPSQIGRAHVCTPVTNAHLVCRLLLEKQTTPDRPPTSTPTT